jgi:VWFA-related protein
VPPGIPLALLAGLAIADPEPYREEARVERVVIDAHVTDSRGDAMPHLTANDFVVSIDGRRAEIESVEWIPAERAEALPPLPTREMPWSGSAAREDAPPGRLLIFFFQTNYESVRLRGLLRMALQARKFLDTLLPGDRVAVVSFDSHLKLRQDFTDDRVLLEDAIDRAIRFGFADPIEPGPGPSLARDFDFEAARRAVTVEKGLSLTARAAVGIPGGKTMLYFGWGLGAIGGMSGMHPKEIRDYSEALPTLAAARINIFTLDVTDADYHTLEVYLEGLADLTGGEYYKTHLFPSLAMDLVARAISGRYVLVIKRPDGPRGGHEISVRLAEGIKGRVNARTFYTD